MRVAITPELEQRFWSKVKLHPTDCWLWLAKKSKLGYGGFGVKIEGRTKRSGWENIKAHRIAYLLANGSLDDAAVIMHKCDNPSCVRPSHLEAGTQNDNMLDCAKKDRNRRILTAEQVREIRQSAETSSAIARRMGVSVSTVCRARTGDIAAHIDAAPIAKKTVWLNRDRALAIKNATGMQKDIARRFGVDPATVSNIKTGKHWGDL